MAARPSSAAAREAGVPAVDGLDLLVGQGALSFELFTGLRGLDRGDARSRRPRPSGLAAGRWVRCGPMADAIAFKALGHG